MWTQKFCLICIYILRNYAFQISNEALFLAFLQPVANRLKSFIPPSRRLGKTSSASTFNYYHVIFLAAIVALQVAMSVCLSVGRSVGRSVGLSVGRSVGRSPTSFIEVLCCQQCIYVVSSVQYSSIVVYSVYYSSVQQCIVQQYSSR